MQVGEVMGLCVARGFVGDAAIARPMAACQRDAQQGEAGLQRAVGVAICVAVA